MKNLNFFIHNSSKLKKNQVRLIKIISILRYLNKNKLGYTQNDILNLANFFLRKDGYKEIKIKTLQKDLGFLTKNNIIYSFIIRLGEYKGSKIKYIPKKSSNRLLRKLLNATETLLERTYNLIYKVNEDEKKEKMIEKFKHKNRTKNSSVYNTKVNNINKVYDKNKKLNHRCSKVDKLMDSKFKICKACTEIKNKENLSTMESMKIITSQDNNP